MRQRRAAIVDGADQVEGLRGQLPVNRRRPPAGAAPSVQRGRRLRRAANGWRRTPRQRPMWCRSRRAHDAVRTGHDGFGRHVGGQIAGVAVRRALLRRRPHRRELARTTAHRGRTWPCAGQRSPDGHPPKSERPRSCGLRMVKRSRRRSIAARGHRGGGAVLDSTACTVRPGHCSPLPAPPGGNWSITATRRHSAESAARWRQEGSAGRRSSSPPMAHRIVRAAGLPAMERHCQPAAALREWGGDENSADLAAQSRGNADRRHTGKPPSPPVFAA